MTDRRSNKDEWILKLVEHERNKNRQRLKLKGLTELWLVTYNWSGSKFNKASYFLDKEVALKFFESQLQQWSSKRYTNVQWPSLGHTSALLHEGKYYPVRLNSVSVNTDRANIDQPTLDPKPLPIESA
jgi:hypothetical protein